MNSQILGLRVASFVLFDVAGTVGTVGDSARGSCCGLSDATLAERSRLRHYGRLEHLAMETHTNIKQLNCSGRSRK